MLVTRILPQALFYPKLLKRWFRVIDLYREGKSDDIEDITIFWRKNEYVAIMFEEVEGDNMIFFNSDTFYYPVVEWFLQEMMKDNMFFRA